MRPPNSMRSMWPARTIEICEQVAVGIRDRAQRQRLQQMSMILSGLYDICNFPIRTRNHAENAHLHSFLVSCECVCRFFPWHFCYFSPSIIMGPSHVKHYQHTHNSSLWRNRLNGQKCTGHWICLQENRKIIYCFFTCVWIVSNLHYFSQNETKER